MPHPSFEQGPIRPPSEARSLLVRVGRNCPWNRCTFCPVYKGERFSLRSADEVIADLDALRRRWPGEPTTVFLQDADPLCTPTDDLVRVLEAVRERFHRVQRITTYARATTLARLPLAELERLRAAGLDRVHVGLESGSDEVLRFVRKGVSRERQIEGGRKARAAGFELSEYVMPGLGGRRLSDEHADETATALQAIEPDFVRLRTTAAAPGTPLFEAAGTGRWEPLGELDTVAEIRRLLAGLDGLTTRLESDHSLNLLMELRGALPAALPSLLERCDRLLGWDERRQAAFVLARRVGWVHELAAFEAPALRARAEQALRRLETEGADLAEVFGALRRRIL